MKYLCYLGCTFLAGLVLVLLPKTATAAEAATPTITGASPVEIVVDAIPSPYLTITGSYWPNETHGLSAHLVNPANYDRIDLETISYTPLDRKMVVQFPYWGHYEVGTYDLVVMTRNGLRGTLESAIRVVEKVTSVPSEEMTSPGDEVGGEEVILPPRPATSTTADNTGAPRIISYAPDTIGGPNSSSTITITGYNWPDKMYGLQAYLLDTETWQVIQLTTISYTPLSGRLVVQTPVLPNVGPKAYDLVVSTQSGSRTVIHNGLWVSS